MNQSTSPAPDSMLGVVMSQLQKVSDSLNRVHTDIALLGQRLDAIEEKRATVSEHANSKISELQLRVAQIETTVAGLQQGLIAMEPIKRLAYGGIAIIIAAVASAVLYLVINQPT